MGPAELLARLLGPILNPQAPAETVARAVAGLKGLFVELAGETSAGGNRALESGLAISSRDAAACLDDIPRTVAFLRGVDAAIQEALLRFDQRPLRLLYAGCGPFAPLVLPLTVRHPAERLRITLIDVHRDNLASVVRIAHALGTTAALLRAAAEDAAGYRVADDERPHLIVSETMQRALISEPQVAIARNLVPQLMPGGLMVPERIAVNAALTDYRGEFRDHRPFVPLRTPLGEAFCVDLESMGAEKRVLETVDKRGERLIPGGEVNLPQEIPEGTILILATEITTFGPHRIAEYRSGLTEPMIYPEQGLVRPGGRLRFRYRLSRLPEIEAVAP
ncbi:SAM-dependent methyltransferase [Endothiovibrio diazotrophicus]